MTSFTPGTKTNGGGTGTLRGTAADDLAVAGVSAMVRNQNGSFNRIYSAQRTGCGTPNASWTFDLNQANGLPVGPTLYRYGHGRQRRAALAPFEFAVRAAAAGSPPVAHAASERAHRRANNRRGHKRATRESGSKRWAAR